MIRRLSPLLLAAGCLLAGCATPPKDPAALAAFKANNDPLEPMNRKIFNFNEGVDRAIIKPVAKAYVRWIPGPIRDGLHNFLQNLGEPVIVANNLLQGDLKRTGITTGRFLMNSTFGLAGILDPATREGLKQQTGDFGQTLYVWGCRSGPYLVLPLAGPSDPRDAVGSGVDIILNPWRYVGRRYNIPTTLSAAEAGASGIDERARNLDTLDALQKESVDFYAALRSYWRQHRDEELGKKPSPTAPPPDLYSDPAAGGN